MKSISINQILFVCLIHFSCFKFIFTEIFNEEDINETIDISNLTHPDTIALDKLSLFDSKIGTKIIGGFEAKEFQFPYQAAIYTFGFSGRVLFCGGSVISRKFVLTAAHCIFERPKRILVIVGNNKLMVQNKNEIRRDVKRYIIHKKYIRKGLKNDICLLELNSSITYSKAIKPIALPNLKDIKRNFLGAHVIVSGFGKTIDGGPLSRRLKFIELRVMDQELCDDWFEDTDITIANICTSGINGNGACQGDSGGPLVLNNTLIGLVSFGARYCSWGYPSVYTRVPCYIKWIANYTNIQLS